MDLKDLMAIGGHPGLFRFVSQGRNAIIVESLESKKRMSAYPTQKISTLEEIAVFTGSGEVSLSGLFVKIWEHTGGRETVSHKSAGNEIRKLFEEVLPEYDREKVYVSDMKKIISWFNLLVGKGIINAESVKGSAEDDETVEQKSAPEGKDEKKGNEKPGSRSAAVTGKTVASVKRGSGGKAGASGNPGIKGKPAAGGKSVKETTGRNKGTGKGANTRS